MTEARMLCVEILDGPLGGCTLMVPVGLIGRVDDDLEGWRAALDPWHAYYEMWGTGTVAESLQLRWCRGLEHVGAPVAVRSG